MAATTKGDADSDSVAFLTKRVDLEHSESWIPALLSACVSHFGSSVKGLSDVASEAYDNAVDLATSELVSNDPGMKFSVELRFPTVGYL